MEALRGRDSCLGRCRDSCLGTDEKGTSSLCARTAHSDDRVGSVSVFNLGAAPRRGRSCLALTALQACGVGEVWGGSGIWDVGRWRAA